MRRNFLTSIFMVMLVSFFAASTFAQTAKVNMDDPKMSPPNADRSAMEATGDNAIPLKSDGTVCFNCARKMLVSGCGSHREYSDAFCKDLENTVANDPAAKKSGLTQ